jgi:hypothetical protein
LPKGWSVEIFHKIDAPPTATLALSNAGKPDFANAFQKGAGADDFHHWDEYAISVF